MLLGKRPRLAMRRTNSMTGISVDIPDSDEHSDQITNFRDPDRQPLPFRNSHGSSSSPNNYAYSQFNYHNRFLASMVSPRPINRRHSADFLASCGLCKKRLAAGKDIYMYRGDAAFCSQECREKQIQKDERKEKCSGASGYAVG